MKALVLAVMLVLTPATALGANMKFCISTGTIYTDSGLAGEDYWTTPSPTEVSRLLTGGAVEIWSGGVKRWRVGAQGYLGDGLGTGDYGRGCTDWFYVPTANTTYTIYVESKGEVNGWKLAVRDRQWLNTGLYPYSYVHSGGAGQFNVAVAGLTNDPDDMNDRWDLLNTYQAAAYSFYRHGGGMACTQSLDVMIGDVHGPGESYTTSAFYSSGSEDHDCPLEGNGRVFITQSGLQQKKFQVTHELGHALFYRFTGKNVNNCSFDDDPLETPPEGEFSDAECGSADSTPADNSSTSWHTIEYAGCAQYEGFAHFYAADVWNDHYEQDCFFKSYTKGPGDPQASIPNVNCYSSSTLYPRAYMERQCGIQAPSSRFNGLGIMIDWVRVYWNVHTDGGGVGFWTMMDWMDGAQGWLKDTAFNKLDDAAALDNGQLETNWNAAVDDYASGGHGIDHRGPWTAP
jgi:hypothetical protein